MRQLNEKQNSIVGELQKRYGLNPDRILFINKKDPNYPWIPPDELMSIARQSGLLQAISCVHDKYVPETAQQIYVASLMDKDGVSFTETGVATEGEELPEGVDLDTETLARGRALSLVLQDAGFHPYRSGAVVSIGELNFKSSENKSTEIATETQKRTKDLRQIHALAREKRDPEGDEYALIVKMNGEQDTSRYKAWLQKTFYSDSSLLFSETKRAAVINALQQLPDAERETLSNEAEELGI